VLVIHAKPMVVYENAEARKGRGLVLTMRGLSKTVVWDSAIRHEQNSLPGYQMSVGHREFFEVPYSWSSHALSYEAAEKGSET
jgi:hypothetical protein